MLSKGAGFDHMCVTLYEDLFLEVSRLIGHPMVLVDSSNGFPIASLRLVQEHGVAFISRIANGGMTGFCMGETPIIIVLTNLLFHANIVMELVQGGVIINDVTILVPGLSVGVQPQVLGDVEICVRPEKGSSFAEAKWTCPDLICRVRLSSIPPHAVYEPDDNGYLPDIFDDDDDVHSPPLVLPIKCVAPGEVDIVPVQLSKADALKNSFDLTYDLIVNKNRLVLASLERGIFSEDQCVICMDGTPDVVILRCGHKVAHDACLQKTGKPECPVCRMHIMGMIHV